MARPNSIVPLCELQPGQEADLFALLAAKEDARTRDNKPYFKVTFRDARRRVTFPVWGDSPLAEDCRDHWHPGGFYKLRAVYRETSYGPQLDILKIRPVEEADRKWGFDPLMFLPQSRIPPDKLFHDLRQLVQRQIAHAGLRELTTRLLDEHKEALLSHPASTRLHHAWRGGYLEHVLSVGQTCVYLATKYDELYPDLAPRLCKDLVVAGGVLHDVGKLLELAWQPDSAVYTVEGQLIGHVLMGRDMVRQAAASCGIEPDLLLRLEHIIVSHHGIAEHGAARPPMTPEALLVHHADTLDARFEMMVSGLADETQQGPFTSAKNALGYRLYRGS
jgi:3'-5' exoribonuclease